VYDELIPTEFRTLLYCPRALHVSGSTHGLSINRPDLDLSLPSGFMPGFTPDSYYKAVFINIHPTPFRGREGFTTTQLQYGFVVDQERIGTRLIE
jgi:hypothetical protein